MAVCQDVIVPANNLCVACASINNGSFDPDAAPGDPLTLAQSPGCIYPLGSTNVTLTVTDVDGDAAQCSASSPTC